MAMQMPYQDDHVGKTPVSTVKDWNHRKTSTEPGATQTQCTTTQMLSDHCEAPVKFQEACASSQIFHVAALNLPTGTAANWSHEKLRQAQLNDQDVKPLLE